jgi:hypothetical protein
LVITRIVACGAVLATMSVVSCSEPEPLRGDLSVHVSVTAAARVVSDTDGFFVAIDQGMPRHLAVVDSVVFPRLAVGPHRVDLTDVRATCVIGPPTPYSVIVRADTIVRVNFNGSCQ